MKIIGMFSHTDHTYQCECDLTGVVDMLHYERLIGFTRGKQHQFIMGKANWTFVYRKKALMSALKIKGHFVLLLHILINFDKIH